MTAFLIALAAGFTGIGLICGFIVTLRHIVDRATDGRA